ncbi:MAG: hypothetical protein QG671_3236 [Actinomycetota bacterium]|nr:hypothetical protein [Actinomycetota bacterium]
MRGKIALGTAAGAGLLLVATAPALAAPYPPDPGGNTSQTGTTVDPGGTIGFEFGVKVPYTPGTTVSVSSIGSCGGSSFAGPATTTTAGGSGMASVSLTFTRPGDYVVTATGSGNVPGGVVTSTGTVHVSGPCGGGGGGGGGDLASTGGSSSTATIAVIGGGLLLAGVGAVVVARRRERNHA